MDIWQFLQHSTNILIQGLLLCFVVQWNNLISGLTEISNINKHIYYPIALKGLHHSIEYTNITLQTLCLFFLWQFNCLMIAQSTTHLYLTIVIIFQSNCFSKNKESMRAITYGALVIWIFTFSLNFATCYHLLIKPVSLWILMKEIFLT